MPLLRKIAILLSLAPPEFCVECRDRRPIEGMRTCSAECEDARQEFIQVW